MQTPKIKTEIVAFLVWLLFFRRWIICVLSREGLRSAFPFPVIQTGGLSVSVIRKQTAIVTVFSVRCYNVTFSHCSTVYIGIVEFEVIFIPCVIDHTTSK
jgi:hypothetical protein